MLGLLEIHLGGNTIKADVIRIEIRIRNNILSLLAALYLTFFDFFLLVFPDGDFDFESKVPSIELSREREHVAYTESMLLCQNSLFTSHENKFKL